MSIGSRFAAVQMQQIRHFIALIEAGSFHRAAEVLNITQPGLTRSIQRLEFTLGRELITRTAKGVTANAFGRALYDYALRVVNDTNRLAAEMDQLAGAERTVVRIGLASNFTDLGLVTLIADFAAGQSGSRVVMTQGFFSEIMLKSLRRGELDVAIGLWPSIRTVPDLVVERLGTNQSSVVCGPRSRFRSSGVASMEALAQTPWIMPGLDEAELYLAKAFGDAALTPPAALLQTNSIEALLTVLKSRDFVSLMPSILFDEVSQDFGLIRLRTPLCPSKTYPIMIHAPEASNSPALEALISLVRRRYRMMPAMHGN